MNRGDFSLASPFEREMLEDAFQAVTKADAWELLKDPAIPGDDGFMFTQNPSVEEISKFMKYEGHSGASYGVTMRAMEFIAKEGWDAYMRSLIISNLKYTKFEKMPLEKLMQLQTILAAPVPVPVPVPVALTEAKPREEEYCSQRSSPPCGCRAAKGYTYGWCGVAGGGVPGCDH